MRTTFLFVVLLFLSLSSSASDGPKEQGSLEVNSGHYAEAYRLWLPLAETGDREVQEAIALLLSGDYDLGIKISKQKRTELARKWLGKSAKNGQVSAMSWLSDAFKNGWLDLPVNEAASKCWADASQRIVDRLDCEKYLPSR